MPPFTFTGMAAYCFRQRNHYADNRFHEDTFTASQRYLRWLTKVSSTPIEGIFVFLPMFLRVTDIKNPKFFDYSSDIL